MDGFLCGFNNALAIRHIVNSFGDVLHISCIQTGETDTSIPGQVNSILFGQCVTHFRRHPCEGEHTNSGCELKRQTVQRLQAKETRDIKLTVL